MMMMISVMILFGGVVVNRDSLWQSGCQSWSSLTKWMSVMILFGRVDVSVMILCCRGDVSVMIPFPLYDSGCIGHDPLCNLLNGRVGNDRFRWKEWLCQSCFFGVCRSWYLLHNSVGMSVMIPFVWQSGCVSDGHSMIPFVWQSGCVSDGHSMIFFAGTSAAALIYTIGINAVSNGAYRFNVRCWGLSESLH